MNFDAKIPKFCLKKVLILTNNIKGDEKTVATSANKVIVDCIFRKYTI
jgi:hypothetical protein